MKINQIITTFLCVTLAFCATAAAQDAEPKQSTLITNANIFKAGVGGQGIYVSPSADTIVMWFSTCKQAEEVLVSAVVESFK